MYIQDLDACFLFGLGFCERIDLFTNLTAILNFIVLNVILWDARGGGTGKYVQVFRFFNA